jgi:hypothetical protein
LPELRDIAVIAEIGKQKLPLMNADCTDQEEIG